MEYNFPALPKADKDGNVSAKDLQAYQKNMQDMLRRSASEQQTTLSGSSLIQKEIENLIVKWALIDPLNLDTCFQICDGTAWRDGSYAKTYWDERGLTTIPNICGYSLRASDNGKGVDPDRADRRQVATGNVLSVSTTVVISFPEFYIKIIKEAFTSGRTVVIGTPASALPSAMFDALTIYGTVVSIDETTNQVTIGTLTGTFTTGSKSLVISGDTIGSFQNDAGQRITASVRGSSTDGYIKWINAGGAFKSASIITTPQGRSLTAATINNETLNFDSSWSSSPSVSKTSDYETRMKNISFLPVMFVSLPDGSEIMVDTTLIPVCTDSEAVAGTRNDVVLTPYELRKALNAEGSAPIYACRAWLVFDGTGTPSIKASGNISSITDRGVGIYTINFTTPLPDSNYTVVATINGSGTSNCAYVICSSPSADASVKTASAFPLSTWGHSTGAFIDIDRVNVAVFK